MTTYGHEELLEILMQLHAGHTEDAGLHTFLVPAAAYCRQPGLIETIDQLVPSGKQLRPGRVVQTLVLDALSRQSPSTI